MIQNCFWFFTIKQSANTSIMKKVRQFAILFFIPFVLPFGETTVDGPYVSYHNEHIYIKKILEESSGGKIARVDSMPVSSRKNVVLAINTDITGKTFPVTLKSELINEPSVFPLPGKQLILSDIEGNFAGFRKLLQGCGVIDSDLNWVFGNGHLVLSGDFVDRGQQVTELLWFIYALEDKARVAGGYVHYILGNHEIMIMSGDTRYVNKKYKESTGLLNVKYEQLFDEHTELGRWLRTKNVIEKIGDNIFVHGGISDAVNKLRLSPEEINKLVKPFYSDSLYIYPDKKLPVLYNDDGPFWYRGYYKPDPDKALPGQIHRTLSRFSVQHIFTGHSIVADTISVWHHGKVINTDVPHHKEGKSEAVLYSDGIYYRISAAGERFRLPVSIRN